MKRTERLHKLHDQILRQFENEQSAVAGKLAQEIECLNGLQALENEVDTGSCASGQLGWQAVLWSHYRQRVEVQLTQQEQVVAKWQELLQEAQKRTLAAFQDAKRWERMEENARVAQALSFAKVSQRASDELAVTRYAGASEFRSKDVMER